MDIPRTTALCVDDFNVGSQESGISSSFSSEQEGGSAFLTNSVFSSEQGRIKMEIHFAEKEAHYCRKIKILELENNELRIENQEKDEVCQKLVEETKRLREENEELLLDFGRLDFEKRKEEKEKKFWQTFFPNPKMTKAAEDLCKYAKEKTVGRRVQKPFGETCTGDCSAYTVNEQPVDRPNPWASAPDEQNMTSFVAERKEQKCCRVLTFDESLTGECHGLSCEPRAVKFEASTSVSVLKFDEDFTDAYDYCEQLAVRIDNSSLVSNRDGNADENCFNATLQEITSSDTATDDSVQTSVNSREEKYKQPDFENGTSNSNSRNEHHERYRRDLLPAIARSLLCDDVLELKNWAGDNFAIDDTEMNAADILSQLDQKGIISAWNLDQLRDFFDFIQRIDIVYLIDEFLGENYSEL